jgi:hypothetical protein
MIHSITSVTANQIKSGSISELNNRMLAKSFILTRMCRLHHARLAVRFRSMSIGRTGRRLGLMLCRRLRTVHVLIGRSPGLQ